MGQTSDDNLWITERIERVQLGKLLANQGKYSSALKLLRKSLDQDRDTDEAMFAQVTEIIVDIEKRQDEAAG